MSTVTSFLLVDPGLELGEVSAEHLRFLQVPRVPQKEILPIVLVYRLQDLMDRSVPRLAFGRVPLSRHIASQLRILEFRVESSFSVFDPDQHYASVVVGVEYIDHSTGSGYVNLSAFVVYVIAVVCQLSRVDVARINVFFYDPG
jgi:hypothetical protein